MVQEKILEQEEVFLRNKMKSIFVAIASLDDNELVPTVLNAFEAAENPDRVFVGVSLLAKEKWRAKDFIKETKKFSKNIRFESFKLDKKTWHMLTVGNGRQRAMDLYKNEDYFLQVDSHTLFAKNWDSHLISMHKDAVDFVKNDKVVLTAYAGYYDYSDSGERQFRDPRRETVENGWLHFPHFVSGLYYHGSIPKWDLVPPQRMKHMGHHKFLPVIKFNANFAFSSGDFVKSSGLYVDAQFFEEEVLQTLNLIRLGYTLVYPVWPDPIIGHLYGGYIRDGYGDRLAKGDYHGDEYYLSEQVATQNYYNFIKDPQNKELVQMYQQYANTDLRFGPTVTRHHFPTKFLNSEVEIVL